MGLSDDFKCPVCVADFSCESPEQFALHVADCTNRCALPVNCGDIKTACPKCHYVYTISNTVVDILFHEEECVRLNQTHKGNKAVNKQGKRLRDKAKQEPQEDSIIDNSNHKPRVLPSLCGVCGQGGRTLFQCQDGCARAFHATCLGLSNVREKTHEPWKCPECTRGLHSCGICGFLGNETEDMILCSIPECGYFYHEICLRKEGGKGFKGPLVCSRHQCNKCDVIEKNMSKCSSCVLCTTMYHKTCTKSKENEFEIPDYFVCGSHKKPFLSVFQRCALKGKVQVGDVVLILEYKNNLLPLSAKCVTDSNQWGVVKAVEDFDLETRLLNVKNFADGTFISLPSSYVLPVTTVSTYASEEVMLGELVAWHVVNELSIRGVKSHDEAFQEKILSESICAFEAKAKEHAIDSGTLMKYAQKGYAAYMANRSVIQFGATSTPIFAFLDTRERDLRSKPLKSLKKGGSSSFNHSGNIIKEPDFSIDVLSDFDGDIPLQAEDCKANDIQAAIAPALSPGDHSLSFSTPPILAVCLPGSNCTSHIQDAAAPIVSGDHSSSSGNPPEIAVLPESSFSVADSKTETITKGLSSLEAKPMNPSSEKAPQMIASPGASGSGAVLHSQEKSPSSIALAARATSSCTNPQQPADISVETSTVDTSIAEARVEVDVTNAWDAAIATAESSEPLGDILPATGSPASSHSTVVVDEENEAELDDGFGDVDLACDVDESVSTTVNDLLLGTKSTSSSKSKVQVEKEVPISKSVDTQVEVIEESVTSPETKQIPAELLEKKPMSPKKMNEREVGTTTTMKQVKQKVIASVDQSAESKDLLKLDSPVTQQKTSSPPKVVLDSFTVQAQPNTGSKHHHDEKKILDIKSLQKVSLTSDSLSEKVETSQDSKLSHLPQKHPLIELTDSSLLRKIKVDAKEIVMAKDKEVPSVLAQKKKVECKRSLKRKRIEEAIPSGVMKELEKEVFHFLEKGRLHSQLVKGLNTKLVTPVPFFRPGMAVHHSSGRRLDSLNHLLMTQDKRNIKCYIQGTKHGICPYEPLRPIIAGKRKPCARFLSGSSALPPSPTAMFVTIDLMSLHNFVSLENAIRYHVRFAVLDREASSWEKIFGTKPPENLEEVFFKSSFEIWFCALDGSRHTIDSKERNWLTFCSSVCHLTVVLNQEDTILEVVSYDYNKSLSQEEMNDVM